jgi:hypothetical protein
VVDLGHALHLRGNRDGAEYTSAQLDKLARELGGF